MLAIERIAKQYKIVVHRIDYKKLANDKHVKHVYKVHAFLVTKKK